MKRRLLILGLFLLALAVDSHAQFVSGTVNSPSCYSGANLPSGTVLHLSNAIFYKASIQGSLTLGSDCVNVIFDHPTGSDVYITDKGKNDIFQYGSFGSTGEVLLQLIGDHGAANYCTATNCARGFQMGGTNNLCLGDAVIGGGRRSLYGMDDAPFYTGQNPQGTNGWNRFIGCTAKDTATTWSFYLDNHASNTTVQGCSADKPILINGGPYDKVDRCVVPGVTVLDRQWDVNMDLSVRFVIGDQVLSSGPVKTSPTLFQWGNTTPKRQWVTVK